MSDLSQIKTISGEYSGFADTVAREALSGKADVSGFELDGNGHISAYNGSAFAGGTSFTGDAQGALDEMYANSGKYILNDQNGVKIGNSNTATLNGFAQGGNNSANSYSLAQGFMNKANGYSLAQGQMCTAIDGSIAQGIANNASNYSQAFGNHTRANNSGMAIGGYNDMQSAAFVIGNGTSEARSDCFYIDSSGNVSAAGKISANGVELGGGGGSVPQYVTDAADYVSANSGMINETVGTVSANSGTWGGSALPISAGPGVQLEMVNGILLVAATGYNETVLWSGEAEGANSDIILSESFKNFDRIGIKYNVWAEQVSTNYKEFSTDCFKSNGFYTTDGFGNGDAMFMTMWSAINETTIRPTYNYYWNPVAYQSNKSNGMTNLRTYKIVGIARKQ